MDNVAVLSLRSCDEVEELRAYAAAGDLDGIDSLFLKWREEERDLSLDPFVTVLVDAVTNNWPSVVQCLLDHGVPMSPGLFLTATKAKSYEILACFLDHGWDINTPINMFIPPALAYVFLSRYCA